MSEQNKKRSKNDTRREHVERYTGEKHKHRIQQEKINEADRSLREYTSRDFCNTFEEHEDHSE